MGAGAWVAMVGSFVALTGVTFGGMDRSRRPQRQVTQMPVAALGAGLAIIASFLVDWTALSFGAFVDARLDAEPLRRSQRFHRGRPRR